MKLNLICKINNSEESIVFRNLQYRGFCQINHEPEGKSKIPDFSAIINNKLFAIEVRRLNQNILYHGKYSGIEEDLKLQKKRWIFFKITWRK
jgi:Holliday junction resolvase